ncbi:DUF3501 family protein [Oceanibacterium hippocampi]|uniref:DUF3501 domain-containing protein n=1 Tax=Oceanibacterium hippocampi TaxID=745714 RepID=A0A1Y5RJ83_9PROT|nr:DUF3501 family protein [Oceanibacterium hippocampi]SLN18806.1 hypothetical protein OCH7691_00417 [Oceanibacterium hippocampi]
MPSRTLTRDDIIPIETYAAERKQHKARILPVKRERRVHVGPDITFYFENFDSMWLQIHEMLYIERGGEAQIADELAAYSTMIPNGSELIATMMIEVEDERRRKRVLDALGGIEDRVAFLVAGERVAAIPEEDVERTKESGKTSSVHFLHFPFSKAQIAAFRSGEGEIGLDISHPAYGHRAVLTPVTRARLAEDFD